MSFVDAIKTCFSKIVTIDGRARRSEFWWFNLFVVIADAVINGIVSGALGAPTVAAILSLIIALCSITVHIRRYHDIGKSGWWILIVLIPLVGWIIDIVWCVKDSDPGDNQFGPNPKGM